MVDVFKVNFLVVILTFSFLGCTQKKKEKKVEPIKVGAFSFIETEPVDKNLLAEFSGIAIKKDEVHKKSRVIQEILEKEEGLKGALLYRMSSRQLDKLAESGEELAETYKLKLYTPEPKETFSVLLQQLKLSENEKIEVEFIGPNEAQVASGLVGSFREKDYTFADVEKNHVRYIELVTQKYDEYYRQITGIFKRKLLFKVAKEKNMPVQDYIKTNILSEEISASPEDVVEFMRSKNIADEQMTDSLKKSFTSILIEKKRNEVIDGFIRQNLVKESVKVYFKAPRVDFEINPEWAPVKGSTTAAQSMYFFTNPNCSVCANAENNVIKAFEMGNYDLNFKVFYFFPEWDREARLYAEASMCAFLQDKDKYWQFHSKLINFEEKVKEQNLYEFAAETDLDSAEFKACVLQRKTKEVVNYHLKYSDYLGINSQPSLVVGGKIYPGVVPVEKMVQVLSNLSVPEKEEKMGVLARVIHFFKSLFS